MGDQFNAFNRPSLNLVATRDPTTTDDTTAGWAAGSIWMNTTSGRWWLCTSAVAGTAVWMFGGTNIGVGAEPSGLLTQFGSAALLSVLGAFKEEGNLYRNVGNPIAGNAADTTDDIICGCVLPASVFDAAGRGISITVQGKTGATSNAGKRAKLWINPTMSGQTVNADGSISGGTVTGAGTGALLVDTGASAINAKGWGIYGNLFKYGALGANTQYFQGNNILDTVHSGIAAPSALTQTESAVMNIVVTGASAQSGASDIAAYFFEVNAMN